MKVEQVAVALPSRVVANEDILDIIHRHSAGFFQGNLQNTLGIIQRMLVASGSNTRRWCAPGENPLDLTVEACKKAIDAQGPESKIDLVINASVFPELIEPSTANLIATKCGLDDVECFDVKEACDGWMKAVKIADALLRTGGYRRILVVNGEFVMQEGFGIFPKLFMLEHRKQLDWRFPGYTLGEGAAATILSHDEDRVWVHSNETRNDLSDLCTITPRWYKSRDTNSNRLAKDGAGVFTSFGAKLKEYGFPLAIKRFQAAGIKAEDVDILFTHSSSKKDWSEVAEKLGLAERIYDLYHRFGNLVSAAVPAAMALAQSEGKLKRGDRVVALVASAGMSFSTAQFVF